MHTQTKQKSLSLFEFPEKDHHPLQKKTSKSNGKANKLNPEDKPFHDWYRFVLSYPPHLVRTYIDDFHLKKGNVLLDPFCGSGTTLVEGKLHGIKTIGIEANPFAQFASRTKTTWRINADNLLHDAQTIARHAEKALRQQGLNDYEPLKKVPDELSLWKLSSEHEKLILKDSISPLPLHKSLILLDAIKEKGSKEFLNHELLALGKTLVYGVSNLHFGPEVGVRDIKIDAPVVTVWLNEVEQMVKDLKSVNASEYPASKVMLADARDVGNLLDEKSIDAVITSPPYPNEKDYTRTTRLESVLLGFIKDKLGLRALKSTLIRSNTRNVYKGDDDDKWISDHKEIQRIAKAIEDRRIELNKDSGFEKLYGRVTKLYFGGMARHLSELHKVLRPGAKLAYVVGDQASYLRVMIRTGELLADIGKALGYEVVRIDLFRTRFASATKEQLREEVVIFQWNGET
ncbi:MAG: DNA methyltransferase [Bacteroidota bacterium]